MVSVVAFNHRDLGSNPGSFAARVQIENWVSQIIQAMIGLVTCFNPMYY